MEIWHLGLNMLALFWLGRMVEPALGHARFLAIYFVSLLTGSVGVMLLTPDSPTLGASGAIYGLLGAAIVMARNRNIGLVQSGLVPILAINLGLTFFMSGISIGGHLGGLVGGLVSAFLIEELLAPACTSLVPASSISWCSDWPRWPARSRSPPQRRLELRDPARGFRDEVGVQRVAEPLEALDQARAGAREPGGGVGDHDPLGAERRQPVA